MVPSRQAAKFVLSDLFALRYRIPASAKMQDFCNEERKWKEKLGIEVQAGDRGNVLARV